jgi:hypothetical protein
LPNTPILGGTYPAGLPGVAPDPAGDIHLLATSLETGIVTRYDPARTETIDTGWSLTPLTLASGWTNKTDPLGNTSGVKGGVRRIGQRVELRVRATRSGGTISPASQSGNFIDTPVFTLASGWAPAGTTYDSFILPGVTGGLFRVQVDGSIQITNFFNGSSSIGNGDVIQLDHEWFIN